MINDTVLIVAALIIIMLHQATINFVEDRREEKRIAAIRSKRIKKIYEKERSHNIKLDNLFNTILNTKDRLARSERLAQHNAEGFEQIEVNRASIPYRQGLQDRVKHLERERVMLREHMKQKGIAIKPYHYS